MGETDNYTSVITKRRADIVQRNSSEQIAVLH